MIVGDMSVDEKCWELAGYFLADEEHFATDTDALAMEIQDLIETFLSYEMPKRRAARAKKEAEP
jgi:hypothetical protein